MKRVLSVKKLLLSLVLAIVITIIICIGYTVVRSILLDAIASHSYRILINFDLIGKIQEKTPFDTIPTIWQLQEVFGQIAKFFIFALGLSLLLVFMPVGEWIGHYDFYLSPKYSHIRTLLNRWKISLFQSDKKWLSVLVLLIIAQYVFCYIIIYYSWWSGDDYYAALTTGNSFIVKYCWWIWCCMTHHARVGEMIYYIFPLTPDRWTHLLITPAVMAIIPLAIMKLATPKVRWCSVKGILFYIIIGSLMYFGYRRTTTICCYATCTAYIYSSLYVSLILPFYIWYHRDNKSHSWLTIMLFCLCSFLMGTSTEGIAAIGSLFLAVQLIWKYIKGENLSPIYYLSLISFWIGATWIMFSPGTSIRGMYTPFVGGNVPYNLFGLSIWEKLSYIPEMLYAIWKIAYVIIICYVFSIMVWFVLYCKRNGSRNELWRNLKTSLFIMCIGLSLAMLYLAGAIPNGSTFTPCCFGLIIALIYLLNTIYEESGALIPSFFSISLFVALALYMIPSISYSMYLKPYEDKRNILIHEQIKEGKRVIRLPYCYPSDYDSIRTVIPHDKNLKRKAVYYHVDQITEDER